MRIMLVTDAWEPQVNGVVRTLSKTVAECRAMGHEVEVIHPGLGYRTFPLPTYPEIKMSIGAKKDIERRIKEFAPDGIHIATEGSLGQAARKLCLKWAWPYSTSYHTKFPEYVTARFPFVPLAAGYWFMRRFHNRGGCMMVATPSMRDELEQRGFHNIIPWARGVDTELFRPDMRDVKNGVFKDLPRPIFINVGRVAVEKNIEVFLETELPGSKVVVGEGPHLEHLRKKYPDAVFTGSMFGEELVRHFADADVFVFPSLTDTFGLVILESMACGTPVAAFPVPGPGDIIPGSGAGVVDDDLRKAALACLDLDRKQAIAHAHTYSWKACAEEFVGNLRVPPMPERRRFWKRLRRLGGSVRLRISSRIRRGKND
ncbi:Glycosyl transferase, group 1 family protein [hydrothermal vent metagenome]|uniref:Glycosyl transferase, group 1 family protein n=1 Tax=hydrothermal vent metagenome TaxID=652676 RepID=A0A3B0SHV1_9ZZZZ